MSAVNIKLDESTASHVIFSGTYKSFSTYDSLRKSKLIKGPTSVRIRDWQRDKRPLGDQIKKLTMETDSTNESYEKIQSELMSLKDFHAKLVEGGCEDVSFLNDLIDQITTTSNQFKNTDKSVKEDVYLVHSNIFELLQLGMNRLHQDNCILWSNQVSGLFYFGQCEDRGSDAFVISFILLHIFFFCLRFMESVLLTLTNLKVLRIYS